MLRRQIIGSIIALAAALLVATTALANGESKNQLPFTAAVAQSKITPDWLERYAAAHPYGQDLTNSAPTPSLIGGEPKNELPFTGPAARTTPTLDWFERYAAAHPYGTDLTASTSTITLAPSRSFHWRDALIGAATAGSMALLCAAALSLSRSRRRDQPLHPIEA
jgi:hypothetical protein